MTIRTFRRSLATLLIGLAGPTLAQDGNVTMGLQIAEEYCSACHVIERGGPFKLDPPSFAAIAVFRSPEQIKARIEQPIHASMPRYTEYMIGGNIDDMVAYIASLDE